MVFKLLLRFRNKSSQVLLFDYLFSQITYAVLLLKPLLKLSGLNGGCRFVLAPAFAEFQVKGDSQRESGACWYFSSTAKPPYFTFFISFRKGQKVLFLEVCCVSLCESKIFLP